MNERHYKLPKWAQDFIAKLQRERDSAVQTLQKYADSETPSAWYTEELVSLGANVGNNGPSYIRHNIQAREVTLDLGYKKNNNREATIHFRLDTEREAVYISSGGNGLSIFPHASNVVLLKVIK